MSTPEISVQLYSIHRDLAADLDGSLARLADIGLRTVEAFDFVRRADALKESFDRHGLSVADRTRHPHRARGREDSRRPAVRPAGRGDLRRRERRWACRW